MTLNNFFQQITFIANSFIQTRFNRAILVHHNDTDGLSAGAILSSCLERMNLPIHRYSIEVLHPLSLKALFERDKI